MNECPKCKASDCVGFNPKNRKFMCHSCLHEWRDAPIDVRTAIEGSPSMSETGGNDGSVLGD